MSASGKRSLPLLAGMVALAIGWLALRSRLTTAPIDAPMGELIAVALGAGVFAALLPPGWIARASRGLEQLARSDRSAAFAVGAAAFAVGLATAASQQPLTWDEPHAMAAAQIVADEGLGPFFARYASIPWLGTNHPPLVIVVFGGIVRLLGPELFPLRLVAVLAGAATVVTCLAIARHLVGRELALLSVLLLLSSPLFDRMCSAAMNDIFVTACFTAAIVATLRLSRDDGAPPFDGRGAFLLGLALGTGLLVKYTMVLAYPVLAAIALVDGKLWSRRREWAIALAVSLLLIGAWLVAAWNLGVLDAQSAWTSRMAGQTTRSARGAGYALDALLTKLPSGLGIQNLPLLVLGVAGASLLERRAVAIVLAWFALVSAPLLLTLPDNRYFLPAYPALAIVGAVGLERLGADRARALILSWLLCGTILAYYALVDLSQRAFLFRRLLQ